MDFQIYISRGSVATQLRCGGIVTTLVQIFHRIWNWKKIENRPIFGKDMDKSLRLTFGGHPVYCSL